MGSLFSNKLQKFQKTSQKCIFDFQVRLLAKQQYISLNKYKNAKVYLIVNVACKCTLTAVNYTELVSIYNQYHQQGLQILAFPCNQFFRQENDTEQKIQEYLKNKFNVPFPLFGKIDINGPNTHPLFIFLRENSQLYNKQKKQFKLIPWNFSKFLINKKGQVISYYSPNVNPFQLKQIIISNLQ